MGRRATIAQLGEHPPCKRKVGSSILPGGFLIADVRALRPFTVGRFRAILLSIICWAHAEASATRNPTGGDSMNSQAEATKIWAAKWIYRWNLSNSMVGIIFSALTFMGVFVLLLGPALVAVGFSYLSTAGVLLVVVLALFFGLGVFLDRTVRFWTAQATVATVRNPYLVNQLYQKELLVLKYGQLPSLEAISLVLRSLPQSEGRERALDSLNRSIRKIQSAIGDHAWSVEPDERVY